MTAYNYKHLYYFWVVAKEGGMSRAAQRLGMAVQTISTQVRELERQLGHQLLKPAGRQMVLLRVGLSDGLPKLAIPRLLAPVLAEPDLKLECHEDEFDDLLADLALHRLDLILADRPAPPNDNVRVYHHALGQSTLHWLGTPALAQRWQRQLAMEPGVHPLARLPVLLPTAHAAVRRRQNLWFEQRHIVARVVGEFEDSALLATFGATGMGVFPAPAWVRDDLTQRMGLVDLGEVTGVEEQFVLIGSERKVLHPLVRRILGR